MQAEVEPEELAQAVALLIQEKTAAVADIQRERDVNLRTLYRMITSVVHGDGMLDTFVEEGQGAVVDGAEGWELFKSEASVQGQEGVRIALPDLQAVEVSSVMEVDGETAERGGKEGQGDGGDMAMHHVKSSASVVPIIQATARQVYVPRVLRPDATDAAGNTTVPRWLNGRPNPAAYEPAFDPRVWPLAATGHVSQLGFGTTHESEQGSAVGRDRDPFEMLIPLEDPYAANLHPLPPVQQPSKHKHHHHRRETSKRDRTRSGGVGTDGVTGMTAVTPDNPSFGNFSFGLPPAYIQASQKRQKIELYQTQMQASASASGQGAQAPGRVGKVEDDGLGETASATTAMTTTINPVLANPTDATTALAPPPPPSTTTTTVGEHEPRGVIVNPIPSSTLAPATRAIAGRSGGGVDLVELGVGFKVNPLSRMMKKTNKCLTSKDWQTAYGEIKYVRAMERIEQLKEDNQWSFRQMRKFKGPTVAKVHWDYVLDEMRWLATDFKEERKWKLAAAYELSLWCQDWYHATDEERAGMSVGGRRWGVPRAQGHDNDVPTTLEEGKVSLEGPPEMEMTMEDDKEQVDRVVAELKEKEEEIALVEKELANVNSGIAGDTAVKDATAAATGQAEGEKAETIVNEDTDADADADADAEGEEDDGEDAVGEVDMEDVYPDGQEELQSMGKLEYSSSPVSDLMTRLSVDVDSAAEVPDQQARIKAGGVGSHTLAGGDEGNAQELEEEQQRRAEFEALVPTIRKPILDVDRTTLGVDVKAILETSNPQADDSIDIPENVGLDDIFPDLAVFGPLTVPAADKVERRLDESSGRLAHVSRLLDIRPIMLTSLNPSRNRAPDGRWMDANGPMYDLADDLNEPSHEEMQHSSDIFRAHKSKNGSSDGKILEPDAPKYPDQRLAALVWEEQDDEVLLRAAKDYDYNWRLVADVVNSARVYVSTEKRTPWDCFDRWAVKIGYPSKRLQALAAANAAAAAAASVASSSQAAAGEQAPTSAATMGTPSLKSALPTGQPLNPSITGLKAEDNQGDSPVSPGGSIRKDQTHTKAGKTTKYEGSKKKVRMTVLRDSIRRIQKRREANKAKQNGKFPVVFCA
ncbi:hypothetical protein QFC19_000665 [Naganishia cerealis]|uniref:Uncharacterized protein n=1 Tax=Naganishia cerealis TaxID=610337 RepID=A0ACC2WLM3_9TREE|nr:hypothetical protein QFC19_000665 [Naganishia cerealis]